MAGEYTPAFYQNQKSGSRQSADRVVPLVIDLVHPSSVADVGCGVGTWLAAFSENGVLDILGIDGDYVDQSMLQISRERFQPHDLTKPITVDRRFDLVCCLEVAEHLEGSCAETLIQSLVDLGPVILFSAAAPYQGGTHHVNEQWPAYWAALFQEKAYAPVDCFRSKIWNDRHVEWWYAQNILLFLERGYLESLAAEDPLRVAASATPYPPLSLVHPRSYFDKAFALHLCKQVIELTPRQEPVILVAESMSTEFPIRNAMPFLERNGVYWGAPATDDEAIAELERMRRLGCAFIVFSWLSFWWLHYYSAFQAYVRTHFRCVRENECLIAFDLRRSAS
jgi:SAM-dependent methyltransferase